jgi:hypothetical protein
LVVQILRYSVYFFNAEVAWVRDENAMYVTIAISCYLFAYFSFT